MVDRVEEILEGMREMRVRNAILVTALRKLDGPLVVSHEDAYESARYDVEVRQTPLGLNVYLLDAPQSPRNPRSK